MRSAASLWIRGVSSNKHDSLCSHRWCSRISKSPISTQAVGRRLSYLPALRLAPLAHLYPGSHSKDNAQNEDEHVFGPQAESKLGIGSGTPPPRSAASPSPGRFGLDPSLVVQQPGSSQHALAAREAEKGSPRKIQFMKLFHFSISKLVFNGAL